MEAGDELVGADGSIQLVSGLSLTAESAETFNFEVADWHTYFVADSQASGAVLVHNLSKSLRSLRGKFGAYVKRKKGAGQKHVSWKQYQGLHKARSARGQVDVKWVKENARMSPRARKYDDGAAGSRPGQAPALEYVDATGKTRRAKFDGVDGRTMVDRKLSVTTFPKSKRQVGRQSAALQAHGVQGRWEVPTQGEANRATKLFKSENVSNIQVQVIPETP